MTLQTGAVKHAGNVQTPVKMHMFTAAQVNHIVHIPKRMKLLVQL